MGLNQALSLMSTGISVYVYLSRLARVSISTSNAYLFTASRLNIFFSGSARPAFRPDWVSVALTSTNIVTNVWNAVLRNFLRRGAW